MQFFFLEFFTSKLEQGINLTLNIPLQGLYFLFGSFENRMEFQSTEKKDMVSEIKYVITNKI